MMVTLNLKVRDCVILHEVWEVYGHDEMNKHLQRHLL